MPGSSPSSIRRQLLGTQCDTNGSTYVSGESAAGRCANTAPAAPVSNWTQDIRTELAQIVYERPIYPKNLYLDRKPPRHHEHRREILEKQIEFMQDRDVWRRPS